MATPSNSVLNDYIAGALGGAAGLIVGHPFDTTKVQLQTAGGAHKGTLDAIQHIKNSGCSKGFFRGLGFPLMSSGVINSVFFGVYGHTLAVLSRASPATPSNLHIFLAGSAGGAAQLAVACPTDVVKVVLQSQISFTGKGAAAVSGTPYFTGPRQCIRWVMRTHGPRGFYHGLVSMGCRDIGSFGLYMLTYENIYTAIHRRRAFDQHGVVASIVSGGTAGLIAWASIMPFDCIKSRLQADQEGRYHGMVDCARKIYAQGGARAFFTGLLVNSLRSFPVNGITFLIYSQVLKRLNAGVPE